MRGWDERERRVQVGWVGEGHGKKNEVHGVGQSHSRGRKRKGSEDEVLEHWELDSEADAAKGAVLRFECGGKDCQAKESGSDS